MRNGTVWPSCSPGPRVAALFPEEAAGEDRLIAQLQFVPAGTPSVQEQDSADLPLKERLLQSPETYRLDYYYYFLLFIMTMTIELDGKSTISRKCYSGLEPPAGV